MLLAAVAGIIMMVASMITRKRKRDSGIPSGQQ